MNGQGNFEKGEETDPYRRTVGERGRPLAQTLRLLGHPSETLPAPSPCLTAQWGQSDRVTSCGCPGRRLCRCSYRVSPVDLTLTLRATESISKFTG